MFNEKKLIFRVSDHCEGKGWRLLSQTNIILTIIENELLRFEKMENNKTKWKQMLKFVEEKHVSQIQKGREKFWSK